MTKQTRRDKATDLLERAKRGPQWDLHAIDRKDLGITADQAKQICEIFTRRFAGWSESWLLPNLYDLVPELRGMDKVDSALERASRGTRQ